MVAVLSTERAKLIVKPGGWLYDLMVQRPLVFRSSEYPACTRGH